MKNYLLIVLLMGMVACGGSSGDSSRDNNITCFVEVSATEYIRKGYPPIEAQGCEVMIVGDTTTETNTDNSDNSTDNSSGV